MHEIFAVLKRSWQTHFWTNVATTTVLSLSFTLVLGTLLVTTNMSRLFTIWGDEIQITIYLKDDISALQRQTLEQSIKNQSGIESAQYVDKKQALQSFEKSLSSYGSNFVASLRSEGDNPFPASYLVRLKKSDKTPEKIEAIAKNFTVLTGVEDVSYGQEWISNYTLLMKITRTVGFILAVTLISGCLLTISNSIQSSLRTRREEIEILELVGATKSIIRKPFIIEGAFQGLIGIAVSVLILFASYRLSYQALERVLGGETISASLTFLSVTAIVISAILSVGLGALGSYICVSRINSGWAAARETLS